MVVKKTPKEATYMGIKAIASLYRLPVRQVEAAVRSGAIVSARIGRTYMIRREAVDAWIRAQEGRHAVAN